MNTKTCKEIIIDNSKIENPIRKTQINTIINDKIDLIDNETIKELYLISATASLSGYFKLDNLSITTINEITLGNDNLLSIIGINNLNYFDIRIETQKLNLIDTTIINNSIRPIRLKYNELTAKYSFIKSRGEIIVNNSVVFNVFDEDGYITVTDKDLLRLELSNKLSTLLNKLNQKIDKRTNKYLSKYKDEDLITLIEYQKEKVEQEMDVSQPLFTIGIKDELADTKERERKQFCL